MNAYVVTIELPDDVAEKLERWERAVYDYARSASAAGLGELTDEGMGEFTHDPARAIQALVLLGAQGLDEIVATAEARLQARLAQDRVRGSVVTMDLEEVWGVVKGQP